MLSGFGGSAVFCGILPCFTRLLGLRGEDLAVDMQRASGEGHGALES